MSAPNNAITVRKEAEQERWTGDNYKEYTELLNVGVICECNFEGTVADLLCNPDDGRNVANNFWCPQCRTRGWQFQ